MKHTIQEKERIEFIQSIQKRAMEKYSQATVWNLDGFQGNLGNLLYETIEDTIASQLQSILEEVEGMKIEKGKRGTPESYPKYVVEMRNRTLLNVQSIISNRMGEK